MSREILEQYKQRGFRLIFYPKGLKGPRGKEDTGWKERTDRAEDWTEDKNVGVFLGTEIAPGKFLADVDFDWDDSVKASRTILSPTGFGFGRPSKKFSHAFFTTGKPVALRQFKDVSGRMLMELRGTTVKGEIALQTMVPPSYHGEAQETLELRKNAELGHVEDPEVLVREVTLCAIVSILFLNLGVHGFGHEARLSFCGFALQNGLTEEETLKVGSGLAHLSGNSQEDFKKTVETTVEKLKAGEKVIGSGYLAKAMPDEVGRKVLGRIREWLGGSEFITSSKGQVIGNNQDNILLALEKLDVNLAYDLFANKSLIQSNEYKGPLEDYARNSVWLTIQKKFGFLPPAEYFDIVLQYSARQNEFHPVREYLSGLSWDGIPRVRTWLSQYGGAADNDYTRAVGAIVLVAAVRRVRQPGCLFHELLVLESEQGMLKSSALQTLCPREDWFSDDFPLNADSKQIIERTAGKWIIEASELTGMAGREQEQLKSMLSRGVDGPARLAYARLPVEIPRQFVVIGTTNSNQYLGDSTGNRRFWPVRIEKFDVEGLRRDRDQLWAEAAVLEKEGFSIRLDPELYSVAGLQQERRRSEDPWESLFTAKFGKDERFRLSPDEVWAVVHLSHDKWDKRSSVRIAAIMQRLGFRRLAVRGKDGEVQKGWGKDPKQLTMGGEQEEENGH